MKKTNFKKRLASNRVGSVDEHYDCVESGIINLNLLFTLGWWETNISPPWIAFSSRQMSNFGNIVSIYKFVLALAPVSLRHRINQTLFGGHRSDRHLSTCTNEWQSVECRNIFKRWQIAFRLLPHRNSHSSSVRTASRRIFGIPAIKGR